MDIGSNGVSAARETKFKHNPLTSPAAFVRSVLDRTMLKHKVSPSFKKTFVPGKTLQKGINAPGVTPLHRNIFNAELLDCVKYHLSDIPTRLLAFDSTGNHIQLVNKRQAEQVLKTKVYSAVNRTPEFLEGWIMEVDWELLHTSTKPQRSRVLLDKFVREIYIGYAILSHTWTAELCGEVSFQTWDRRRQNTLGNAKITNFCKVSAQNHGCFFGWIDTCCINKESSAELDEAIRSMYRWYRNAAVCVIYLSETASMRNLRNDPWFTRGWTLQELVAPRRIEVYNKTWEDLATYYDKVPDAVANAARITSAEMALFRQGHLDRVPISRRLQMGSLWKVTREEDSAYSLMGLLDVSISTAYGEGSKRAFSRLMREIISTKRHVLDILNHSYGPGYNSVIPDTIEAYEYRSDQFDVPFSNGITSKLDDSLPIEPLLLTHIGLRIPLLLVPDYCIGTFKLQPQGLLNGTLAHYSLFDAALVVSGSLPPGWRTIFGVVNFTVENDQLTVSNPCLSIPLTCNSMIIGKIKSSDSLDVGLRYGLHPPVFTLSSTQNTDRTADTVTVAVSDIESYGLQLITLYL